MGLKRGIFFSADAFIALSIILLFMLTAMPIQEHFKPSTEIHRDLIKSLSSLKIGEIENSYVQSLVLSGDISDTNKTVLEQIGEFYVTDINLARALANSILSDINISQNIGIWYQNTLIASKNRTSIESAKDVEVARQLISGIRAGENVTGYSARAFLASNLRTSYFYFGGYVGDGNITILIDTPGNVFYSEMELVINRNFDLYINDVYSGSFFSSPSEFTPIKYTLPIMSFHEGSNKIEFRGNNLHMAGGFVRVTYQTEEAFQQGDTYRFPGINGLINVYDGFYVPGTLTALEILLHMNTNYSAFLTIGNTTVYKSITDGEESILLTNSALSPLLDYNSLSRKTVPLRLGLENVSYITGTRQNAFVFSVTDISGSMDDDCPGGQADPGEICKINNAKEANKELINNILQAALNRIGLVGYDNTASNQDFHPLSNNNITLQAKVDEWTAGSGTCICCGINKAISSYNFSTSGFDNVVSSRVSQSSDDAEECLNNNNVQLTSSDLELIRDTGTCSGSGSQQIGMRFQNINVPLGANIISAYIQFETDEISSENTNLIFFAQNIDNAPTFTTTNRDITSRQKTTLKAIWSDVPAWSAVSRKYNTTDISQIIQEVVNRAGWNSGNSIVIIANGTGRRVAESFNGESANAPLLVISYKPDGCGNSIIEIGLGEECDDGNNNNNDACTNSCKDAICGDGILYNLDGGTEQCDDNNLNNDDGCSSLCTFEGYRAMIVMSDGLANVQCAEQNTGDPRGDAIQAACEAYQNYNLTVHAVGFGSNADQTTLQNIASCGGGDYYFGNIDEIVEIYRRIAENIVQALYYEQTINATEEITTTLYPDSYVKFTYDRETFPYGLVITSEKQFDNEFSGSLTVPLDASVIETKVASYSGPRWTDRVRINSNEIYNIRNYSNNYIQIGDPYTINIPNSFIQLENSIDLTIGISPTNSSNGSISNKIISTIIKNVSSYSDISPKREGCNWTMEFEDSTNISMNIPQNYSGSNVCYYTSSIQQYDSNDAIQNAVYDLLGKLDLEHNNKINPKLTANNLQIQLTELSGIPYVWSTEVQVRTWN